MIYLMKKYGGEEGLESYNQLMEVGIYAILNPKQKMDRYGTITPTTTLAGWTSMETRNIAINFDICNKNWKLTEILAHESWHSRTGKGYFHEGQAYSYGYRVRTSVFPWTGGTLWYGLRGWR